MVRSQPQPELNDWGVLAGLPLEELRPLKLSPGELFHDREHLPPGVLLIQEGQMRLLALDQRKDCLLYTSPSPRDGLLSRMPSSA